MSNVMSLGAARAQKLSDASQWTPEEALGEAYRCVVEKEWPNAQAAIACTLYVDEDGETQISFCASSESLTTILGLMERVKDRLLHPR